MAEDLLTRACGAISSKQKNICDTSLTQVAGQRNSATIVAVLEEEIQHVGMMYIPTRDAAWALILRLRYYAILGDLSLWW